MSCTRSLLQKLPRMIGMRPFGASVVVNQPDMDAYLQQDPLFCEVRIGKLKRWPCELHEALMIYLSEYEHLIAQVKCSA